MTDYDSLYAAEPHALGDPTPAIAQALVRFDDQSVSILDVGCGQGRDALPLARKGHRVTGFDPSGAGIAQMLKEAAAEQLPLDGVVCDIDGWTRTDLFDVVLIDRVLHMIPDSDARSAALAHLLANLAPGGSILISDERANMAGLRRTLTATPHTWARRIDTPTLLLWTSEP